MGYKYEAVNGLADAAYYDQLRANSKRMRANPTMAEEQLWQCLRAKRLGVKFRRQHVIGEFIADFICMSEMLIIEVDGGYHLDPIQEQDDRIRTEKLNSMGYRVIRFTNDEVLYQKEMVLESIRKQIRFTALEDI